MINITTICLIRHGETDWNAQRRIQGRTDIPLNEKGIQQARECRDFLKNSEWDLIITSPLKRAKQTAEIINEALNIDVIEMDEFIEKSFGDVEGMTLQERRSAYPDRNYPNQEDDEAFSSRIQKGIEKIQEKYEHGKVILVAHGAVISTLLAILSDGKIGTGKTRLGNACISNIHFHEGMWLIKDYNQISHLSN